MSDSKIDDAKFPTLHNMTEKHTALYEIFCKARAEHRAMQDPEDIARREEFLDAGKKAAEGQCDIEIVHEKSAAITDK